MLLRRSKDFIDVLIGDLFLQLRRAKRICLNYLDNIFVFEVPFGGLLGAWYVYVKGNPNLIGLVYQNIPNHVPERCYFYYTEAGRGSGYEESRKYFATKEEAAADMLWERL